MPFPSDILKSTSRVWIKNHTLTPMKCDLWDKNLLLVNWTSFYLFLFPSLIDKSIFTLTAMFAKCLVSKHHLNCKTNSTDIVNMYTFFWNWFQLIIKNNITGYLLAIRWLFNFLSFHQQNTLGSSYLSFIQIDLINDWNSERNPKRILRDQLNWLLTLSTE